MKIRSLISCVTLLLASPAAWGAENRDPAARFASSGKVVSVRLPSAGNDPVTLRALGRNWTDPITPRDGAIEVELPLVRVPTAFSVVPAGKTGPELVRVVAYPADYRLPWDKQVPLSFDAEAPLWFKEWLIATGLPAMPVKLGDSAVGDARLTGGTGLLVVGRSGAGKTASEFVERQTRWQINVLVLEAGWFGEQSNDEVRVPCAVKCFHHALAELNRFTWPQELSFRGVGGPWAGIANRWVWIDGATAPLVEEFRASAHSRRMVFSYLPWLHQLGIETADSMFLAILKEAARKQSADEELDREFELFWPAAETVSATKRPVLTACLREREARRDETNSNLKSAFPEASVRRPPLSILDLRGPALATSDAESLPVVSRDRNWLVLGSDPAVSIPETQPAKEPGELVTERKHKVIHFADDTLPSSTRGQVRLMQELTDQGVFIGNLKIIRSNP
jgi:hypothetical protein